MTQMVLQIPDELAERIEPIGNWLPTIIELSLIGFRTLATITATQVIEFLASNPTPHQVLEYHVPEDAQLRLERLLTLNEAGMLGEAEQLELDELQHIEHVLIMLKARVKATL